MLAAPVPPDEPQRQAAVQNFGAVEERFDRITRVAAAAFGVPIAAITLVDTDRRWLKSSVGLEAREWPGSSFCGHAILGDDALVIADVLGDERFSDDPLVTGPPHIRFYAGHPLRAPGGEHIGTLSIIDRRPRELDDAGRALLRDLASWAREELGHVAGGGPLDGVERPEAARGAGAGGYGEAPTIQATEAALRESERRFRAIFDRAGLGIGLIDLDTGTMVDANPALGDLLGWTVPELLRLDRDRYNHPDDAAEDGPLLDSLRVGRADRYRREKRYVRRDGSELWTALTVTALPEADERPHLAIAIVEDITRRKEVERLKDEFISVIGHELRTPLTSIRGSLGLVEAGVMGALPPEAAQMVSVAVGNTDRLVRLINDMLDMERMESGRGDLQLGAVTAESLIEQAVGVLKATGDAAQVVLHAAPTQEVVWADPDRVVQALSNLLGNAVKFSPAGSAVEVSVRAERRQAVFTVRDAGRGIPARQLESIFERFRQVDASDAREKGGTGLGLAISRAIVEHHGGRIWAESVVGEGAAFHFTIPLVLPAEDLGAEMVLVVEDDRGLGDALAEAMRAGDTRVARSAEEAVAVLGTSPPGVIVLDIALPGRSGEAVIQHLREHSMARTPVIVYSALDLGAPERARLQLGRTVFMSKADSTPRDVARCAAQVLRHAAGAGDAVVGTKR